MRFVVFILVSIAIHVAVLNFYFVQKEKSEQVEQVTIQIQEEKIREAPPEKSVETPKPVIPKAVPAAKKEKKVEQVIKTTSESPKQEIASSVEKTERTISVVPPQLKAPPAPGYPVSERKAGHEGSVLISVSVGADGALLNADVKRSSGYKALDRAALASVKKCAFKPGLRGGVPYESSLVVEVVFKLK